MKLFKFLGILFLLSSCNAPQAVYDYDQQVNFQKYKTYALFPDFKTGLSQLDEQRLIRSIDEKMQAKGFTRAGDPGIYVNVYTQTFQEDNRSRVGIGVGGGGGNVGVGVSGGIPLGPMDTILKLTFDFIDVEKDNLVWQAVIESPFDFNASPEKRQSRFDKIVETALEGYPPKK
ncbi:DUF4136 domain-containing protein [Christiangramia fulva]|uniref:DUF4136 domain-containing protein n=1 Tax=Christiangramia fulva TaxID=2126553 RepID=A0A2R3Z1N4_9FLAO|nr:DUF4136 domain-containing protein [Christiangramia fulva]AVR44176.1 DUF4136 domain-containing protein [Christiangramia fulva]